MMLSATGTGGAGVATRGAAGGGLAAGSGGAGSACAHKEARTAAASIGPRLLHDHAREPSKGSRPSHDRLRPAKPGSVYAIMRGNPRRVRAPSRDRLRPAKPGSVYAITTRSCPASTAVPSAQRTAVTRPARGARSSFSIFIASRTTTVWPACTVSSALTSSLTTRPGIGERIVTGAASFPARAGAAILARRASATSAASTSGSAPGRRISMVSLAPAASTAATVWDAPPRRIQTPGSAGSTSTFTSTPSTRGFSPSPSSTSRSRPSILTANRRIKSALVDRRRALPAGDLCAEQDPAPALVASGWAGAKGAAPPTQRSAKRGAFSPLHEGLEALRSRRVAQLAQRLGLDLADALARHLEVLPHLFQRVVGLLADPEAHAQHLLLARGQRGQHLAGLLRQVHGDDRVRG